MSQYRRSMEARGTNFSMSMMRVEFKLHRVELLLVEQDIFAFGDLEALHQVAAGDFLAGARIKGLHADAVVGLWIDQVESDSLRLCRSRP